MGSNALQNVPPQNLEAEQSLLGSVLLENEALFKALEIIKTDDFYRESHRQIYQAMIDLYEKNEPADLITVTEVLKRKNKLDEAGGASYLADLLEKIPTAANIEYYAKIIRQKSILRSLISSATEIVSKATTAEENVEDILDFSEKTIFQISEYQIKPSFYPLKTILKSTFKDIERLYEQKQLITGVPSGFTDLDAKTSGFQPSDLIIIAGRPSMGKTAFCLNIAQHASQELNIPIAIFSLEMSKEQLALRMLCSEARVDNHKLRTGNIAETDWGKLSMAAGKLADSMMHIDDTPGLNVFEMRTKARKLKAEQGGLGMIIVDYLQLMAGSKNRSDSREQEISEISRSLKGLAKELHVPVIALSQLNRKVEDRVDKRPHMADLRESGAIEQDADVILFIYRDEVYHPDSEESRGKAEVIIGKQRNGPTGEVQLTFINDYTRFENYSYRDIMPI
jgi:replicative DNA helicase